MSHLINPRMSTNEDFERWLTQLGADQADPVAGFFGPESMMWRVGGELSLYLAGMRALLLQIAHPKVAAGVAQHSDYAARPLERAIRTFTSMYDLVFGDRDTAVQQAAKIHGIHNRVRGKTSEGADYDAHDPELLRWVAATLLDSSLLAYQTFVEPLSDDECEGYFQDTRLFEQLFGLDPQEHTTLREFNRWFDGMLHSDRVVVSPTARDIAQHLLDGPKYLRGLAPLNRIFAAGMLPPILRQQYGLVWDRKTRIAYATLTRSGSQVVRRIPPALRRSPQANRARLRCTRPVKWAREVAGAMK